MFNHCHYVPVLRWKRGEWLALKGLDATSRAQITPILEIPPKHWGLNETPAGPIDEIKIRTTADQIAENWGADRAFVDLCLISSTVKTTAGRNPLIGLFERAKALQLSLIPVADLLIPCNHSAVSAATSLGRAGAAIRLYRADLTDNALRTKLATLVTTLGIPRSEIDLIVDLKKADDNCPSVNTVCSIVPELMAWRTFSVVSGAFPKDLTGFSVGDHVLDRVDWLRWKTSIESKTPPVRLPAFGDYVTQHPIYSEPPSFANFSASIRYASEDKWVIMRGEGVRNDGGPGYAQWPANAQLLCAKTEFLGQDYCEGDAYIYQTSLQTKKTGNAETWLRAGFNHHLTLVARQVAAVGAASTPRRPAPATGQVMRPQPTAHI